MKFKYTDYHLHTKWSVDIVENGPSFSEYIEIAERNRINICFLEHFELLYIEREKSYPFYDGKINVYLEEIDILKETYDFILAGLEVDYYENREIELSEFMDDFGNELDFIAGTIHEWVFGYPVTNREKVLELSEKISMKKLIDDYFKISEMMINSQIFKNVCHIDTIFRYINPHDIVPTDDCNISEDRVLKLGQMCIKNKINIEYNLSGLKFPLNRPFPSKEVVFKLKKEGANFFVGSDSHSISYFESQIPKVKKAYNDLAMVK